MGEFTQIEFVDIEENAEYIKTINEVDNKCFLEEHLEHTNLYVSINLTDSTNIRKINKQYRNIDKETDVLSFPMFEKEELDKIINNHILEKLSEDLDNSSTQEVLGDIIISIPRVEEQAKEYGHSFERELAYMLVHGFYHLRGYDHMEEDEKKVMRQKEEAVLMQLDINR